MSLDDSVKMHINHSCFMTVTGGFMFRVTCCEHFKQFGAGGDSCLFGRAAAVDQVSSWRLCGEQRDCRISEQPSFGELFS